MDYIEEFIEDNIKIIVITFIVLFVVLALYFIFREKKTYEIVTCQSDGGYFERSFTNKNTNDSCDLAINAGSNLNLIKEIPIIIEKTGLIPKANGTNAPAAKPPIDPMILPTCSAN